jgi:hypothetical protein
MSAPPKNETAAPVKVAAGSDEEAVQVGINAPGVQVPPSDEGGQAWARPAADQGTPLPQKSGGGPREGVSDVPRGSEHPAPIDPPATPAPQDPLIAALLEEILRGRPNARVFVADGRAGATARWSEMAQKKKEADL